MVLLVKKRKRREKSKEAREEEMGSETDLWFYWSFGGGFGDRRKIIRNDGFMVLLKQGAFFVYRFCFKLFLGFLDLGICCALVCAYDSRRTRSASL